MISIKAPQTRGFYHRTQQLFSDTHKIEGFFIKKSFKINKKRTNFLDAMCKSKV